mmetsp:Transcript_29327/g.94032  ORF Transcript_29327/g.94032 Transcript_29327/m.94032 type:complete len:124 (+) Transcript_29327:184-555(+)
MSANEIAQSFIQQYYTALATNVDGIAGFYSPQTTMCFEGTQFNGPEAIVKKFKDVGQIMHMGEGMTIDVMPGTSESALLIFVVGRLKIAGNDNPLMFSEMFQLVAVGPGQFYVHNQIRRLVYA